jgi:hypothetical protein
MRNQTFRLSDQDRDNLETVRLALEASGHYLHPVKTSDALRYALAHAAGLVARKGWKP